MKFKLDENLSARYAEPLVEAGHEVATVPEQQMSGWADTNLIQACREEHRCLVTLDLGFGNPLVFDPSAYHGIAVLRVSGRMSRPELTAAMQTLARGLEDRSLEGKLWIVQPGRIREYQQG